MDEKDWLAERFEANRSRLRAVAYRMLGSTSEADDVVQDAWFRLSRSDTNAVENLDGWLTTVVGRLCLDVLRSRQARRQDALDPRVPDPVVMREDAVDPEEEALLADSVGMALLVVLDMLAPAERLAFVSMTCSACLSTRSRPSSGARRRRPASSPVGPAAACRAQRQRPTSTSAGNERWWTPSLPPPGKAISRPWSACSIPMSCSAPTPVPVRRCRWCAAVPRPSARARCGSPTPHGSTSRRG